jgi:hypothetical protein
MMAPKTECVPAPLYLSAQDKTTISALVLRSNPACQRRSLSLSVKPLMLFKTVFCLTIANALSWTAPTQPAETNITLKLRGTLRTSDYLPP